MEPTQLHKPSSLRELTKKCVNTNQENKPRGPDRGLPSPGHGGKSHLLFPAVCQGLAQVWFFTIVL